MPLRVKTTHFYLTTASRQLDYYPCLNERKYEAQRAKNERGEGMRVNLVNEYIKSQQFRDITKSLREED